MGVVVSVYALGIHFGHPSLGAVVCVQSRPSLSIAGFSILVEDLEHCFPRAFLPYCLIGRIGATLT